jgi:hypothetical protein
MRFARRSGERSKVPSGELEGQGAPFGAVSLDRRSFLARSGAAAAMLSLAASIPGGATLLGGIEPEASAVDTEAASVTDAVPPVMTDPVVAHVTDVTSGQISIYSGTQEVVVHDLGLAAQLVRASR